jgi:hypothetical protein
VRIEWPGEAPPEGAPIPVVRAQDQPWYRSVGPTWRADADLVRALGLVDLTPPVPRLEVVERKVRLVDDDGKVTVLTTLPPEEAPPPPCARTEDGVVVTAGRIVLTPFAVVADVVWAVVAVPLFPVLLVLHPC